MKKPILQEGSADQGLVEQTIGGIRNFIRENQLLPGSLMPSETAMAAHLDVSRTVTREAFRALATLGIIEVSTGRRARVGAPDAAPLSTIIDHTVDMKELSIQQVLDVRRTLELRTAKLAALRRSEQQAREILEVSYRMMEAIDDPETLMELDIGFHELIAQSSGNSLYGILVGSFRVITKRTWLIGWKSRATIENRKGNILCHQRLAEAIMTQDASLAEETMTEHFDSASSVLLSAGIS
ncbi:FadR/GntR family transcriptional regulator [Roseibium suaedae]|uniref:Transcriptional regulator, GntR family n=1 Tax=Roseibium suaedae TaxID=735517 RepID=A0A1M7P8K8_9HYPH|nr:FadR/GntR family transcriptional regulator [Roseibium suaedae]SHN12768.1 transcriptional regulator, GntR family [Roseibium suaedae]